MSSARRISRSSLFPTRMMAAVPDPCAAMTRSVADSSEIGPCSVSMMQKSIPAWPSVSTRGGDGMITKGPTTISPFWRRFFNEPIRGMESPVTRGRVCPARSGTARPSQVNRNHFVDIH